VSQRTPVHFIESLARGMKILQSFSAERPYLTLQNLSDLTGFNKTATQRLTDTLLTLGFLGRNQDKKFFLEPRVLTLGFAYLHGSELRQLVRPHIESFGRRVGRTTNLAILDGNEVVLLYRYEIQTFYKFNLHEGSRLPTNGTSLGKVLLASFDPDELNKRLDGIILEQLTNYTITDPKLFRKEIALTRARGYGINDREGSLALFSVAAPLINHEGKAVAAVGISLPAEEAEEGTLTKLAGNLLAECERCSALLGYQGFYPWKGASLGLGDLERKRMRPKRVGQ
jgi:IclR family transcriptional regulator, pca regulon regulatory protein